LEKNKGQELPNYEGKKKLKNTRKSQKYSTIPKLFYFCIFTSSQIWLNPSVDDCQPTHLTTVKRKTTA
jgi:hypothetical protein